MMADSTSPKFSFHKIADAVAHCNDGVTYEQALEKLKESCATGDFGSKGTSQVTIPIGSDPNAAFKVVHDPKLLAERSDDDILQCHISAPTIKFFCKESGYKFPISCWDSIRVSEEMLSATYDFSSFGIDVSDPVEAGRPSPEKTIRRALAKIPPTDKFWKLLRIKQAEEITKQCGRTSNKQGWGKRNVQGHILEYVRATAMKE
jgi:hypothetical protein